MPRSYKKSAHYTPKAAYRLKNGKKAAPAPLFCRVKGLKDVLPDEYKYWHLVFKKIGDLGRAYNFRRNDLPLLEPGGLYDRIVGRNSQLVMESLMTITMSTNEKIVLRPDVLPSLLRSWSEHGLLTMDNPSKNLWLGPVIYFDPTQGGRPRQFTQASFDILGASGPTVDAQLILIAYNFFQELQLETEVQINSIGCNECRPLYLKELNEAFKERGRRGKLCADCRKHLFKNPLAVFDCHEEGCADVAADLPPVIDHLCDTCHKQLEKTLEFLDNLGIAYNLNPKLFAVRGFEFWQRVVYEFLPAGESRRHFALASGGNYSPLLEIFGAKPAAGSGLAVDIERTISRIRSNNIAVDNGQAVDIFMAQLSEQAKQRCMLLFEELRRSGFKVREYFICDNLKGQLDEAERLQARFALILGQKELIDDTILLRDMESGVQETIDLRRLASELDKRLNIS